MGPVAIGLFYLGEALIYTTIWFSLISCFFKSPVRRRSTWVVGFILITIILAIINAFIASFISLKIYAIQSLFIPILVSLFYWFVIKIFFNKNSR